MSVVNGGGIARVCTAAHASLRVEQLHFNFVVAVMQLLAWSPTTRYRTFGSTPSHSEMYKGSSPPLFRSFQTNL